MSRPEDYSNGVLYYSHDPARLAVGGEPLNRFADLLGVSLNGRGGLDDLVGNDGVPTSLSRGSLRNRGLDQRRNLYADCGFPDYISPQMYQQMYERNPIAARVVEVMPKESWQVQPTVFEDGDPETVTVFEEAWDNLGKSLSPTRSFYQDEAGSAIWSYLLRTDALAGIGQYGVIFLGLDDGLDPSWPVAGFEEWNSSPEDAPEVQDKTLKSYVDELGLTLEQAKKKLIDLKAAQRDTDTARAMLGQGTRWTTRNAARCHPTEIVVNTADVSRDRTSATPRSYVKNRATTIYNAAEDGLKDETGVFKLKTPKQTADPAKPGAPQKKSSPKRRLLYVRVFSEASASITQFEANRSSPRFGQPTQYLITLNARDSSGSGATGGVGLPTMSMNVHWTRVIHVTDNRSESEVFHVPRMRAPFNNLLNLEKIYGASAEGYWQSCFNIISFETNPQLGGNVVVNESRFKSMMENVRNGLQREFILKGMSAKAIAPSVTDPTPFIDSQKKAICNYIGVPMRVFDGSERGELASTSDDASWNDELRRVQLTHNTPDLIIPFVDRLILCGVLPEPQPRKTEVTGDGATGPASDDGADEEAPAGDDAAPTGNNVYTCTRVVTRMVYNADTGSVEPKQREETTTVVETAAGYSVEWPDLESQTKAEKATVISTLTTALSTYTGPGNASTVVPPLDYFTKVWDMEEEEVQTMLDSASQFQDEQHQQQMDQQQEQIDAGVVPDPTQPQGSANGSAADPFAAAKPVENALCSTATNAKDATGHAHKGAGPGGGQFTSGGGGEGSTHPGDVSHESKLNLVRQKGTAHEDPKSLPNVKTTYEGNDQIGMTAAIKTIFGKDVHPNQLAAAANAREGANVHVKTTPNGSVRVTVANSDGSSALRTFYKTHKGELIVSNDAFNNRGEAGKDKTPGAVMLRDQVQHLRELGVNHILTLAAGEKGNAKGYVGYTVWPKLGYDGHMTDQQFAKLPPEIQTAMGKKRGFLGIGGNRGTRSLLALHSIPGGAEAWKQHGSEFMGTFDLKDHSPNMKALDAYLAKKGYN